LPGIDVAKKGSQFSAVDERTPISFVRRRQRAELHLIAVKIAADTQFFNRFKATIDGNDQPIMEAMMLEVRRRAKEIDPQVSVPDGTRIIVVLAELAGAFPSSG